MNVPVRVPSYFMPIANHDAVTVDRIYLSPPHLGSLEQQFVQEAFDTNWIAPVGPHVDAFEHAFAEKLGAGHAVAVTSGTAALHLALILNGVEAGDDVFVSTMTFCASVNPILYLGARPVFVDSERESWNMDVDLLTEELGRRAEAGILPKAVVLVHIYGQCADIEPIRLVCEQYNVVLIEDAAEALGATYRGQPAGTFGKTGIFSFNGNKIITTSGGGMLVTEDDAFASHARKLATQAREPASHYEHAEVGYNYRMSNVLAGIGRGQLAVLDDRIDARRRNFDFYHEHLRDLPGLAFMPEAPWGRATRWLTCLTVDPVAFGADREAARLALEELNIEARPVWKPMHLQPVYQDFDVVGGAVAEELFAKGLCLPSGSNLRDEDLDRIIDVVHRVHSRR